MRMSRRSTIVASGGIYEDYTGTVYSINYVTYAGTDVSEYFPNAPKEAASGTMVSVPEADDNYTLWYVCAEKPNGDTVSNEITFTMPEGDIYVVYSTGD